jgi:hypothetical protein
MRPYSPLRWADRRSSRAAGLLFVALAFGLCGERATGESTGGEQPIVVLRETDLSGVVPSDSLLLVSPTAIEEFLVALEQTTPDWGAVYGRGHHDESLDERLFELNRERDERRKDNPMLARRITFRWSGALSPYDLERGGFPVAIGPEVVRTAWGFVRFKPEALPGNLTAVADAELRDRLVQRQKNGEAVDLAVAMTGRLIPDESLVYDFSHEEEGQGLIMPVVQVEAVQYVLVDK